MMYLEIISPEKMLFAGGTKLVELPGTLGSFEIMENHAPIISTLASGKIKAIATDDSIHYFEINGGLVEHSKNGIRVLVE